MRTPEAGLVCYILPWVVLMESKMDVEIQINYFMCLYEYTGRGLGRYNWLLLQNYYNSDVIEYFITGSIHKLCHSNRGSGNSLSCL